MSNAPGGYEIPSSPLPTEMPHRPADDTEQVYYDGSPKLRGQLQLLFIFTFIGLLVFALPIVLRYYKGFPSIPIVLLCCLVGVLLMFVPPLKARMVRYRITNYRIDYERGLLSRNIDTLELWHVEDIHFHQSIFDRMLNVGTIIIVGHDETTPKLEMIGIPNPRPLYETLKQRVISVKRQQGVIKTDPG